MQKTIFQKLDSYIESLDKPIYSTHKSQKNMNEFAPNNFTLIDTIIKTKFKTIENDIDVQNQTPQNDNLLIPSEFANPLFQKYEHFFQISKSKMENLESQVLNLSHNLELMISENSELRKIIKSKDEKTVDLIKKMG